jgi:hypothetical protein
MAEPSIKEMLQDLCPGLAGLGEIASFLEANRGKSVLQLVDEYPEMYPQTSLTSLTSLTVGGRYHWRHNPEPKLVYVGHNRSGNGYWHQFEQAGKPGKIWCEIKDDEIHLLEETNK